MSGDYDVDEFFSTIEEEWGYEGHLNHPRIKEEVEEVHQQGVSTPISAYLVCEKYACPLNPKEMNKKFNISINELHEAREKTGMKRPNFNQAVTYALNRKGILLKEYAKPFLKSLNTLTPGTTRYESVAGSYLLLKKTPMETYQWELAAMFNFNQNTLQRKLRKIRSRFKPQELKKRITQFQEKTYDEKILENILKNLVTKDFKEGRTVKYLGMKYWVPPEKIIQHVPEKELGERLREEFREGRRISTLARHYHMPGEKIVEFIPEKELEERLWKEFDRGQKISDLIKHYHLPEKRIKKILN